MKSESFFFTLLIRICCRSQSFLILTPSFLSGVFLPSVSTPSCRFCHLNSWYLRLSHYATCPTYLTRIHLISQLIQSDITARRLRKADETLGAEKIKLKERNGRCRHFVAHWRLNFTCIQTEWAYADNNNDCFGWATELTTDSSLHTIVVL